MTPAEVRADYRSAMVDVGWTVKLRRTNPSPTAATEINVLARIVGLKPEELSEGLKQGDSKAIVLAEDVEGTAFTLPFKTGGTDKIVDGTKQYNIEVADPQTRKLKGVVVAYDIVIRG